MEGKYLQLSWIEDLSTQVKGITTQKRCKHISVYLDCICQVITSTQIHNKDDIIKISFEDKDTFKGGGNVTNINNK